MTLRDLRLRLRAIFRRGRAERDMDDEVAFHLERQAHKHMAAGIPEDEARRLARIEFGNPELVREDVRDARGVRWFEELRQDARYALRGFARTPTFAITVVVTIGLALGLNSTVFAIFNAYVLRPLEIRDPYTFYDVGWRDAARKDRFYSAAMVRDLARSTDAFDDIIAHRFFFARMDGQPSFGELVSGNYFEALGVPAARGRTLRPDDALAPGSAPVVVISHTVWMSRYGGDSGIVGRRVDVHGVRLEVVGVARKGFAGIDGTPRDFWVPATMTAALSDLPEPESPDRPEVFLVNARLRPGITPDQAGDRLLAWARVETASASAARRAAAAVIVSRATPSTFSAQQLAIAAPIIVAFALVLVIAAANVANMMLARGLARQREIGIRLSLGAERGRLVRQLLTEAVLLAIPASILGFFVARGSLDAGVRLMVATIPAAFAGNVRIVPLQPDIRAFLFILGVALVSVGFFGLLPALQATRPSVVQAARGNFDAELRPSKLRDALVLVQVVGASVLLIVSGILVRNSHRMNLIDPGVRTANVIEVSATEKGRAAVLRALRVDARVTAVTSAERSPLNGLFNTVSAHARGDVKGVNIWFNLVTPEYFGVYDIPIVTGRGFTPAEGESGAAVAVVSQSAARTMWPGRDPIGEVVVLDSLTRQTRPGAHPLPREAVVIGVARDASSGVVIFGTDRPVVYFPSTPMLPGSRIIVRMADDAASASAALLQRLDRAVPGAVDALHTMDEFVAGQLYPFHAAYLVSSAIGMIALLLTLTGVYGVLSYVVSQRSREIGIRIALGATETGILSMVVGRAVRIAVVGGAIGALFAAGGTQLAGVWLQLIKVLDAPAYAAGLSAVLLACTLGALAPARRATRVDPVRMLRQD